ncbi:uncharacterized protein LOC112054919 [Bicyclus anynana]|uniref:Uncharacterized protein LOC112054919 n=1 Tax=Bicyclus anynana TaxID=110368 RepID=A0A6J1P2G1_BICAN|nr:uncharacterized protein LOC112054919 [Bicyclus anynana]
MVVLTAVNGRKLIENLPRASKHRSTDNNADFYQATYQLPVDFKHLTREGIGDGDFKQPFDGLRYKLIKEGDLDRVIESLPKLDLKSKHELSQRNLPVFSSPRDEIEYYNNIYNSTDKKTSGLFDFSSILEKNLRNPFISRREKILDIQKARNFTKAAKAMPRKENTTEYFQKNRFFRKPQRNSLKINWTTCDEFAINAVFHPDDIVNIKWLPFFIWSKRGFLTTVTHTFSHPTKKNVQYYRSTFGPHYKNIDWQQPKLLMKERRNMLLIAGDRKGLFYGIPDHELPEDHHLMKNLYLPTIKLRLKIHDPYLAMMYCDDHYAAIMAELGTGPKSEHDTFLEASTLNFKGKGTTVRRDIEEEKFIANMQQRIKIEDEENKFIRIHRPIGDVDIKVRHAK